MEDLITKHSELTKGTNRPYELTSGKAHAKITLEHTIKVLELMCVGVDTKSRSRVNNFLGDLQRQLKEIK